MEEKKLICIQCPMGCNLTVSLENGEVTSVVGNECKRGEIYAKKELISPTRTVTSTMKLIGGSLPVISVKTKSDIPKHLILDCMKEINSHSAQAPVRVGDVLISDVCGTGVAVVATSNAVT